jgi:hypothetical protein
VANVNVRDNQTVVLGGLVEKNIPDDKKSVVNPPANEKELLVFVTATIVDPAGNRVHADDDLPPAKTGIPPQPQKTMSGYFDDLNPNEQGSFRRHLVR